MASDDTVAAAAVGPIPSASSNPRAPVEYQYTWAQVEGNKELYEQLRDIYTGEKSYMPFRIRALLGDAFCHAKKSENDLFPTRPSDDPPLSRSVITDDHFRPLVNALRDAHGKKQETEIASWTKAWKAEPQKAYSDISVRYAKELEIATVLLAPPPPPAENHFGSGPSGPLRPPPSTARSSA